MRKLVSEDWACSRCGENTNNEIDYYMLKNSVWSGIVKDVRILLCLSCAEYLLGRKIERKDIIDCPLNKEHPILKELFR